jgi:hypothetical protein
VVTIPPRRRASDKRITRDRLWLAFITGVVIWTVVRLDGVVEGNTQAVRASCERSQQIGPALARFYEREGALTPTELALYIETIPTICP